MKKTLIYFCNFSIGYVIIGQRKSRGIFSVFIYKEFLIMCTLNTGSKKSQKIQSKVARRVLCEIVKNFISILKSKYLYRKIYILYVQQKESFKQINPECG